MVCLKPPVTHTAKIITATLNDVATMASLIIKDEKAPFCLLRYLRAMSNGKFTLQSKQKYQYKNVAL